VTFDRITRQQRFVRRSDSQATPSSKQKEKSRDVRTRQPTVKSPATIRRDNEQLRVHLSGNCRFVLASAGRHFADSVGFIR
jgi:hypothetical protein